MSKLNILQVIFKNPLYTLLFELSFQFINEIPTSTSNLVSHETLIFLGKQ